MRNLLCVAIGGSLGAVLRYLISDWLRGRATVPLGTLAVNVLGCFLMGLLVHAHQASTLSPATKLMLGTGLLGGLTTFSTFSVETLHYVHAAQFGLACTNIALNVILSMLAVMAGAGLGRWL